MVLSGALSLGVPLRSRLTSESKGRKISSYTYILYSFHFVVRHSVLKRDVQRADSDEDLSLLLTSN